jgi:hypothetical protein
VAVDENSNNPAGRAYLSSATEDGLGDAHSNSDTVQYYAYQAAATTGSQTIGMSAPGSQAWAMIGMEILDAPATPVHTGAFIPFFDSL